MTDSGYYFNFQILPYTEVPSQTYHSFQESQEFPSCNYDFEVEINSLCKSESIERHVNALLVLIFSQDLLTITKKYRISPALSSYIFLNIYICMVTKLNHFSEKKSSCSPSEFEIRRPQAGADCRCIQRRPLANLPFPLQQSVHEVHFQLLSTEYKSGLLS